MRAVAQRGGKLVFYVSSKFNVHIFQLNLYPLEHPLHVLVVVELAELAVQSGGAVTQAAITQLSHNPPVQGQVVRQNSWKAQSVANIQLIQNFLAPRRYLPVALPTFEVFRPHIVVIDLVDDAAHSFVKSTRGQLAPDYT